MFLRNELSKKSNTMSRVHRDFVNTKCHGHRDVAKMLRHERGDEVAGNTIPPPRRAKERSENICETKLAIIFAHR